MRKSSPIGEVFLRCGPGRVPETCMPNVVLGLNLKDKDVCLKLSSFQADCGLAYRFASNCDMAAQASSL